MKTTLIGIDPSSRKLAVVMGVYPKPEFTVVTTKLPENHTAGAGQAFKFMDELLGDIENPVVFLEAPVLGKGGAGATIPQAQIGGAIMAACFLHRVPLTFVHNASWKKRVCGKGNMSKPEIAEKMAVVWPELYAYADGDQDIIDAGGIYLFGKRSLTMKARIKRGLRR